ncbi:MAG: hypothetical protein QM537_06285 [Candidatus Symbiobacter sp.]|nr:hypothetical protein [Candidatus Symbiobacter sp.]
MTQNQFEAFVEKSIGNARSSGEYELIGKMAQTELAFWISKYVEIPISTDIVVEDRLLVGKKAERHKTQGNALSIEEWKSLPRIFANDRTAYCDTDENKLVYILPSLVDDRTIKLVVEVGFKIGRKKNTLNVVRSAFKLNPQTFADKRRFTRIK